MSDFIARVFVSEAFRRLTGTGEVSLGIQGYAETAQRATLQIDIERDCPHGRLSRNKRIADRCHENVLRFTLHRHAHSLVQRERFLVDQRVAGTRL